MHERKVPGRPLGAALATWVAGVGFGLAVVELLATVVDVVAAVVVVVAFGADVCAADDEQADPTVSATITAPPSPMNRIPRRVDCPYISELQSPPP